MVILSLGDGWYSLENCKEGPFFWSSDVFSVYVETPLLELEFYLNCNKTKTPYKLKYSLNGWITEETVDLNSGMNVLNVVIDGKKRMDFKCEYFIPSQITVSTDNRKLGVQLFRVLCKTTEGKCYELDFNELKPKFEVETENNTGEIDKSSFKVTFGIGWHDLEEDKFRWSNGRGILHVKDSSIKALKLNISSPINQKIVVKTDLNKTFEFKVEEGNQHIFLNNIEEVNFIEILSKQYIPSIKDNSTLDDRKLGIQLYSIDVSYENFDTQTYLAKNVFFEKDYIKLTNFLDNYSNENKLLNFNSDGHVKITGLESNKNGKFNLNNQTVFYTHRSGWAYAINSIKSLHSDEGVLFEGFLERTFSWEKYNNIKKNIIPLKVPWVGVIHNPMLVENNKSDLFSTTKLFNSIVFQKSLETCKGLYVLSNDLKEKLKDKVGGVPIEFHYHPTETTNCVFTLDKFQKNFDKKIISLGSWARKFLSIFLLNSTSGLKKAMIEPPGLTPEKFKKFLEIERSETNSTVDINDSVEMIGYQSSKSYDELLSTNIMFMDFYDISASNLIIECIVRDTPVLVKKHKAVIDYLGEDYPFYFETIQEASEKINDKTLIEKTYNYLTKLKTKKFLTGDYFLSSIKKGKIYTSLETN
jgi:hypothetical protein